MFVGDYFKLRLTWGGLLLIVFGVFILLKTDDHALGIMALVVAGFHLIRNYWLLKRAYKEGKPDTPSKTSEEKKTEKVNFNDKKTNYKKSKKITMVIAVLVLAVALLWYFSASKKSAPKSLAKIDNFPIWLLRDGKVAVYRELNFYNNSMEKYLVVANLGEQAEKGIKIYESVPKTFAQRASDLEFNIQPEIIQDDPVFAWTVDTNSKGERIAISMGIRINLSKVSDACKGEQVLSEMVALKLKPESFQDCMEYWRGKEREAQERVEKELQQAKEKVTQVIQPDNRDYAAIQKKAKETLRELQIQQTLKRSRTSKPSTTSSSAEKAHSQWTVYFSKEMFPSSLSGLPLVSVQSQQMTESCYDSLSPGKFMSAVYREKDKIIVVAATQYPTAEVAKTVPKICSDFTEKKFTKPQIGASVSLEKKNDILGYPFWTAVSSYQGSPFIAGSFSVIEDTVVAIVVSSAALSGGTETEHQNAMTVVLTYLKQKVGCGGDSDCKNYSCSSCVLGQPMCIKGQCTECLVDDHCKDGFTCKNNHCLPKETSSAESAKPPTPVVPVCGTVKLSDNYSLYTYSKQTAPCSEYQKSISSNQLSLKCKYGTAEWRNWWVKRFEVAGLNKIKIKADLKLVDHSGFFNECSEGVKSDDYVGLIILSSSPNATLGAECNRIVSSDDWAKCNISNNGPDVLAHCGVPKCTEDKKCDMEVDVSGKESVYFAFRTADAWLADIEGSLSNLEVCSVK